MKKISITILLLLLGIVVKAQDDITLFRLVNSDSSLNKTFLASHNPENNLLVPKEITNSEFNIRTAYLNALILVPHPTLKSKGGVLIVLAKNKKLYLKNNIGKAISFEDYSLDSHESEKNKYVWYLNYAGVNNKVYLTPFYFSTGDSEWGVKRDNDSYSYTILHDSNDVRRNDTNRDKWKVDNRFVFNLQSIKNSL